MATALTPPGAADGAVLRLPAPAKINLFLHVLGRRPDGMHRLQTVFQLLDWGDEVELTPRADREVRMAAPTPGVPGDSDLAYRAALLHARQSGGGRGVDIRIRKRIPLGGGLGGASSDAATVLHGLDALASCPLGEARLLELALELGADVPLFVRGRTAWAEGVGEQLAPLDIPERWFVVVWPGVSVSTAEAFSSSGLTRDSAPVTISGFLGGDAVRNDLEPVAVSLQPEVGAALDWLGQHGSARMSGSGSSVFMDCASEEAALALVAMVPDRWRAWSAKGVAESPLRRALAGLTRDSRFA